MMIPKITGRRLIKGIGRGQSRSTDKYIKNYFKIKSGILKRLRNKYV